MSLLWKAAAQGWLPIPGAREPHEGPDHWIPGEGWASGDWEKRPPWHHIPTPANPCGCEHIEHDSPSEAVHPPYRAPAGRQKAMYVGPVCDDCAEGHMAPYLLSEEG